MAVMDYYNRDGSPITLDEWSALLVPGYQQVRVEDVGEARVSTVWLGRDHNYALEGPPLIFETMIFGGPHDCWCWRYTTEEQAVEGHNRVVARLAAGHGPENEA